MHLTLLKIVALCSILAGSCLQRAYSQPEEFLMLPALTDVSTVAWKDQIYRFPAFQKGKITYTTGSLEHEFDLNYNQYFEKMDFISSSGDTLNITNTREIKAVSIGDRWFLHDYKTGYYEVILTLPIALAVKNQFVLEHLGRKQVGYVSMQRDAPFTEVRGVITDYDRYYDIRPTYFLVDRENKLLKATKGSIMKLFPRYREKISEYFLERDVNFESLEDLTDLLKYCNQFILPEKEKGE